TVASSRGTVRTDRWTAIQGTARRPDSLPSTEEVQRDRTADVSLPAREHLCDRDARWRVCSAGGGCSRLVRLLRMHDRRLRVLLQGLLFHHARLSRWFRRLRAVGLPGDLTR